VRGAPADLGIAVALAVMAMFFCLTVVLLSIAAIGEAYGITVVPHLLAAVWLSFTVYTLQTMVRAVLARRVPAPIPIRVDETVRGMWSAGEAVGSAIRS
jgi:hypothetical protein